MSLLMEKTFEGPGARLNYAEGPDGGPPLLLLHGIADRWQTWLHLMQVLVLRWHVFALDHRGHGRSAWAEDGYGAEAYASDAAAFLEANAGALAVLVGHSLGARSAALVAADRPELVRALVLEDPPLTPPRPDAVRGVGSRFPEERELLARTRSFDGLVEGLQRIYAEADAAENRERARKRSMLDPEVFEAAFGPGRAPVREMDSVLPRIRVPTLLIHGAPELGGIVSADDARRVAALVPDLIAVRIEGAGHGIHRGRPVEFARAVTDYLESL